MTTQEFFDRIYELLAINQQAAALHIVYDHMNSLLLDRNFDLVKEILVEAINHIKNIRLSVILSMLTVCWPWEQFLDTALNDLRIATRSFVDAKYNSQEAEQIMQGL